MLDKIIIEFVTFQKIKNCHLVQIIFDTYLNNHPRITILTEYNIDKQ